jgi:hypothetical protein
MRMEKLILGNTVAAVHALPVHAAGARPSGDPSDAWMAPRRESHLTHWPYG